MRWPWRRDIEIAELRAKLAVLENREIDYKRTIFSLEKRIQELRGPNRGAAGPGTGGEGDTENG